MTMGNTMKMNVFKVVPAGAQNLKERSVTAENAKKMDAFKRLPAQFKTSRNAP